MKSKVSREREKWMEENEIKRAKEEGFTGSQAMKSSEVENRPCKTRCLIKSAAHPMHKLSHLLLSLSIFQHSSTCSHAHIIHTGMHTVSHTLAYTMSSPYIVNTFVWIFPDKYQVPGSKWVSEVFLKGKCHYLDTHCALDEIAFTNLEFERGRK